MLGGGDDGRSLRGDHQEGLMSVNEKENPRLGCFQTLLTVRLAVLRQRVEVSLPSSLRSQ